MEGGSLTLFLGLSPPLTGQMQDLRRARRATRLYSLAQTATAFSNTVACTAGFPCSEFFRLLADQGVSTYYPNAVKRKVP
jgi:hypothetical protein